MRARRFAMMTEEQKSKVAELKRTLAATTTEDAAREVRVVAVSLKRELRQTGTTAREFAAELGVHESTVCRWERDVGSDIVGAARGTVAVCGKRSGRAGPKGKERAARFRMVEVTTATPTTPTASMTSVKPAAGGLRVAHAPSGLIVDGLDVETLAALLRRMS
jgi:DNA-binding transcriptional regulator YiaG